MFFIWPLVIILGNFKIGVLSEGRIYPQEALTIREGEDIHLICAADPKEMEGRTSIDLTFYYGNHVEVKPETIEIINSTAISYTLKNAKPMSTRYVCKLKLNENNFMGIAMTTVNVGNAPQKLKYFKCRSYNFDYFLCEFEVNDTISTKYLLKYEVYGTEYDCKLNTRRSHEKVIYFCNMTLSNRNSNRYRPVHEFFNFTFKSSNIFGEREDNYLINNYDNVIPGKLTIDINETSTSAVLGWNTSSLYRGKGLVYDISILSEYKNDTWTHLDTSELLKQEKDNYNIELNHLNPYTWYEVKIKVKVATAENITEMWSENVVTFTTLSDKPDEPPQVDVGSFRLIYNGSAVLYWKTLPTYKRNAAKLRYIITEIKENNTVIKMEPQSFSEYSALYNLKSADYEFSIKTENEKGKSEVASVLRIPRKKYPTPEHLTKIYKNDNYTLRWSSPTTNLTVKDYTIFSCISKAEFYDQCERNFSFIHVDRNTRNISYISKERMNFAVSANYMGASSGMVWATCTALVDGGFDVMAPKKTFASATSVRLEWHIDCLYSSVFKGFKLYYCPISGNANTKCIEEEKVIQIPGEQNDYLLTNLSSYTTYKIVMSMFSDLKIGPPSEPVYITTLEAAPSAPRRLTFSNITADSVVLKWSAPEYRNGKIRFYHIVYNGEKIKVEDENIANREEIEYTLKSLSSYTCYKIYVKAMTTEESISSNDIHIRTAVGMPGRIEQPRAIQNHQKTIVKWSAPEVPSGRIEFYELQVTVKQDNYVISQNLIKIRGTKCTLSTQGCENGSKKTSFEVRAVNVDYKTHEDNQGTCGNYGMHAKRDTRRAEYQIESVNSSYDSDDTPKASTVFKRHSNAEIDVYHDSNYINRLNTLPTELSNKEVVSQQGEKVFFGCEEHDPKLEEWLTKNRESMKIYQGSFSIGFEIICQLSDYHSPKALVVIFVVLGVILTAVVGYFASRKFQRMKDIDIAFPPGLTDLVQDNHPKGLDNVITRNMAHSDESLNKNENHPFLNSSRLDTGYHNSMVDCTEKEEPIEYEINSDDLVRDEDNSGPTDSVEMSDLSDSTNSSPAESPNMNLRGDTMTAAPIQQPFKPVIINGYVQQQSIQPMLQKRQPTIPPPITIPSLPINNTNYIKCSFPLENDTTKHKDPNTTSEMSENICGYVTPKQLSEFGQRLQ